MTATTTTKALAWLGLGVAELTLLWSDTVTGIGYDLLLSAVVLTILGAMVWAIRVIVPAHVEALRVMQMTTEGNAKALAKSTEALTLLTDRLNALAIQATADGDRIGAIEVALTKLLGVVDQVAGKTGVPMNQGLRETQLIHDKPNPGGK